MGHDLIESVIREIQSRTTTLVSVRTRPDLCDDLSAGGEANQHALALITANDRLVMSRDEALMQRASATREKAATIHESMTQLARLLVRAWSDTGCLETLTQTVRARQSLVLPATEKQRIAALINSLLSPADGPHGQRTTAVALAGTSCRSGL